MFIFKPIKLMFSEEGDDPGGGGSWNDPPNLSPGGNPYGSGTGDWVRGGGGGGVIDYGGGITGSRNPDGTMSFSDSGGGGGGGGGYDPFGGGYFGPPGGGGGGSATGGGGAAGGGGGGGGKVTGTPTNNVIGWGPNGPVYGPPTAPADKITNQTGTTRGGRVSGGAAGAAGAIPAPTFDRPAPFVPTSLGPAEKFVPKEYKPGKFDPTSVAPLAIPEYKPPEKDEKYELQKREEFSAAGKRMLGKKGSEAILTTRNIDNPNARAKMLEGVMQGFGQGLEGVMSEAGGAANRTAVQKHAEEVQTYATNWSARGEEARNLYNTTFNAAVQNFMLGEQASQANVNAANQAGLFNLQNAQAIAIANNNAQNAARMADWNLSSQMYAKSPNPEGTDGRMKPFTGSSYSLGARI